MPGKSSSSPVFQVAGILVAAVAIVGTVYFNWEFGSLADPIPIVVGIACALLAVALWQRSR